MAPNTLQELLRLSDVERMQLAQDLWDSIPPDSAAYALTDEQRMEYRRRLAEHDADPDSAIPWEEARARLRDRFGG
jgi:putative addiction module component (TIGR02574 family)